MHAESEADSRGRDVERIMLLPAALLVAFAICLTFAPGLEHIVHSAATGFHDGTAIRERILHSTNAPLAQPSPEREQELRDEPVWEKYSIRMGTTNLVLAFVVAALALNRKRLPLTSSGMLKAPLRLLRDIHSGAVGDYVAWLTAGIAVFSGAILSLFRVYAR